MNMDLGEEFQKHFENNPMVDAKEYRENVRHIVELLEIVIKNQTEASSKIVMSSVVSLLVRQAANIKGDTPMDTGAHLIALSNLVHLAGNAIEAKAIEHFKKGHTNG